MARWSVRRRVYGLLLLSFLVPAVVWGLSEVVTRDSTQTPCPAIDDSTSECRQLRYNAATKGLDVNLVGTSTITVGAIGGASTPADGFANPSTAVINQSLNQGYNGSAWDRLRTASASSLTSIISQGALTVEKGTRWSIYHVPAVSLQATASRAAGVGGVRHVADCISFNLGATTAPAADIPVLILRDGASGSGTILWQKRLPIPATTGTHVSENVCGLNLVGSAATAMTLEFNSGVTNEYQSLTLTGFDVQ